MAKIFEVQISNSAAKSQFTHLFPTDKPTKFIVSDRCLMLLKGAGIKAKITNRIDTGPIERRIIYPYSNFLHSTPDKKVVEEVCAKIVASKKNGKLPYAIFLGRNIDRESGSFILDRAGGNRSYQWKLVHKRDKYKSLAETFPKLLKYMNDKDTKIILSFGAGGVRFFAHPAVMTFLNAIKARPNIDEVWGCSGGAFSAYSYAMGVSPEDLEQKGYDIYQGRSDLGSECSRFSSTKRRLFELLLPTSPNLLREYAMIPITMRNALCELITSRQLEIPFYCTAFNIRKEQNDVLTPLKIRSRYYKNFIFHADAFDSILASCTVPILYVPKMIKMGAHREYYIDGSIAEDVPLLPIYRKWIIDRRRKIEKRSKLLIIAINSFPEVSKQPLLKHDVIRNIPFVELVRYCLKLFDLFMNSRFDEGFDTLSQNPHVKILRINLPLKTPALLDYREIPNVIKSAKTNLVGRLIEVEKTL